MRKTLVRIFQIYFFGDGSNFPSRLPLISHWTVDTNRRLSFVKMLSTAKTVRVYLESITILRIDGHGLLKQT